MKPWMFYLGGTHLKVNEYIGGMCILSLLWNYIHWNQSNLRSKSSLFLWVSIERACFYKIVLESRHEDENGRVVRIKGVSSHSFSFSML